MPDITVIQMQANSSGGTENALANIDIPEDGTIVGIQWAMNADLDADGEFVQAELSFIATNQDATNDARGVISAIATRGGIVTSGGLVGSVNFHTPLALRVAGGERLYLHAIATAGVNANIKLFVHFEPVGGSFRRSARRR